MDKTTEEYANKLGFKKVFPDNVDKSYFFLKKDIKHDYFNGLHVIIEENISVYCKEDKSFGGQECLIFKKKYSKKNILNVLKWLGNINI